MARILAIEDNPTNLELMAYLLRAFGYEVLEATDGEVGLAVARRERPDLIICDVQMPGVDGYEVARQLKSDPTLRMIPLLAITALAMVGDRHQVLVAGFDGYIAKPLTPQTFVQQVAAFLQPNQRITSKPEPSAPAPKSLPRSAKRVTILAVDNSPVNLSLMRSMLAPSGYAVVIAAGVRQALLLARQAPPDLILSDLHMPYEDGFDLLKAVKADPTLCSIPFMFIPSTVWGEQDQKEGRACGARKFIVRPIEPQALLAEVEACLRQ